VGALSLVMNEQCKAKFPGRQLVYVSRNWGFTPFPKDVYTDGRQMTAEGKIDWRGAEGIIKADGVGTNPRAIFRSAPATPCASTTAFKWTTFDLAACQ